MKIESPSSVLLPRKTKADKKVYLNLNVYRNLHYISNNKAKEIYNEKMSAQLSGLKLKTPIKLTFILHRGDKRKGDRSNPLSIVEKFFCDALVFHKCIPDDKDDFIYSTHYYTGEIDKGSPYVEILIEENDK